MNSSKHPRSAAPRSWDGVDVVIGNAPDPESILASLRRSFHCLGVPIGLAVVDACSSSGDAVRPSACDHGFQVVTLAGREAGAGFALAMSRGNGAWVLVLDGACADPAEVFGSLWEARSENGLITATDRPAAAGWRGQSIGGALTRCGDRAIAGMLQLPVTDPFPTVLLCRRDALRQAGSEGFGRAAVISFSVMVHVLAAGYGVCEIPMDQRLLQGRDGARCPRHRIASLLPALAAARRVRNSFRSADYDYRAHFSLRPAQRYWQRRRYRLVSNMVGEEGGILDVGSGSSYFSATFPGVTAVDLNPSKVRFLKRFNSRAVCGDAERMPFPDASFTTVVCSVVIEHIPGDRAIPECVRVLKPGGHLIIGTPDYDSWQWPLIERVYGWLHPDGYAEDHVRHYTREGLLRELTASGMEIVAEENIFGGEVFFRARKAALPGAGGTR